MGIQGVGAPTTAQVQQVQKNEQQKQPRQWAIATGTAASAALGAWTGWDCAGIKYVDRVVSKPSEFLAQLGLRCENPTLSREAFEALWENSADKRAFNAQTRAHERGLKLLKKARTKWAVIGGVAAALLGGALAIKAEKNWATTGKVKNAKDNPLVSQVVTTTTGQVIEIPVMMGSTTKVKALPNQKYQITHKVITPGAKAEKTIITEQELIEKFGKFDKQA